MVIDKNSLRPHEIVKINKDYILLVRMAVLLRELRQTPRTDKNKRDQIYLEMLDISENLFIDNFLLDVEIFESYETDRPQARSIESIFNSFFFNRIGWDEIGLDERNERHQTHLQWGRECDVVNLYQEKEKEAA